MFSEDLIISGLDPAHVRNLYGLISLEESRVRRLPMAFALLHQGRPELLVVGGRTTTLPAGFETITADNAGPWRPPWVPGCSWPPRRRCCATWWRTCSRAGGTRTTTCR